MPHYISDEIQSQLHILRTPTFPVAERVAAGNALAVSGDPRFAPNSWYLPDDPTCGFIEIPSSTLVIGSPDARDSNPEHGVTLPRYWIARYPVTVAQWRAFLEATGYRPKDSDSLTGISNHPVVRVTGNEALQYCEWVNPKMREIARSKVEAVAENEAASHFWSELAEGGYWVTLPSDAEWERAARYMDGRSYPWGDTATPEHANYADTDIYTTSPVGAFPQGQNVEGVEELSGNVWEWTRAPDGEYPAIAISDGYVYTSQPCGVRGGSFFETAEMIRATFRTDYYPSGRRYNCGFRLVVSQPHYRAIQEDDT